MEAAWPGGADTGPGEQEVGAFKDSRLLPPPLLVSCVMVLGKVFNPLDHTTKRGHTEERLAADKLCPGKIM